MDAEMAKGDREEISDGIGRERERSDLERRKRLIGRLREGERRG